MPKHVNPIIIEETDRNTLEDIVTGRTVAGEDIVKRARAILMMSDGVQLKDIAAELGVRPNTITDIRNRFLENGMSSLSDRSRSGRPIIATAEDIEQSLNKVLEDAQLNGTTIPSVKELSQKLKAPEAKIRGFLQKKGIVQTRKTAWDFRTFKLTAQYCDIVGLYMSPDQQIIITQTSSNGSESVVAEDGNLTIRNRTLALKVQELQGDNSGIELSKALEAFGSIESKETTTHSSSALAFIQSVIESFPASTNAEYHIFACGKPIIENGRTLISGAYLHNTKTVEEWDVQVESIINVLYQNGDNAETIIGICNGIENYIRLSDHAPDVFEWKKSHDATQKNSTTQKSNNSKPIIAPGTIKIQAQIMGDNGEWITVVVNGNSPVTQADFDASSKEAYLQSFHQVEQSVIAVTHEASRSLNEKYMNETGKKNDKARQALPHC